MPLSNKKIESLLRAVSVTRDNELNCDDCMAELSEFAERNLTGKTIEQSQVAVKDHLQNCPECCEEYEALLRSLSE